MYRMTPVRAIRAKCLVCAGGKKSIRTCESESCPLYPYLDGSEPREEGNRGAPPLQECPFLPETPGSS